MLFFKSIQNQCISTAGFGLLIFSTIKIEFSWFILALFVDNLYKDKYIKGLLKKIKSVSLEKRVMMESN